MPPGVLVNSGCSRLLRRSCSRSGRCRWSRSRPRAEPAAHSSLFFLGARSGGCMMPHSGCGAACTPSRRAGRYCTRRLGDRGLPACCGLASPGRPCPTPSSGRRRRSGRWRRARPGRAPGARPRPRPARAVPRRDRRGSVLPGLDQRVAVAAATSASFSQWTMTDMPCAAAAAKHAQQRVVVLVVVRAVGRVNLDRVDAQVEQVGHPAVQRRVVLGQLRSASCAGRSRSARARRSPPARAASAARTSWPGNCVAKSMTVVTPPQAAVRVPISQSSGVL